MTLNEVNFKYEYVIQLDANHYEKNHHFLAFPFRIHC